MNLIELVEKRRTSMTAENAVSLLLPAAIELRNLHRDGNCHLEISPKSISIAADGAALCHSSGEESARYASGFAAPEIYSGEANDRRSDIYSFCAVLAYAVTGKTPSNSLTRNENTPLSEMFLIEQSAEDALPEDTSTEDEQPKAADETAEAFCVPADFVKIIEQGMVLNKEERTESMQDLIQQLVPYNTGDLPDIVVQPDEQEKARPVKNKPRKKRKLILILSSFVATLLVFVGIVFLKYYASVQYAKEWNFTKANDTMIFSGIVNIWDRKYDDYLNAGMKLESRDYVAAANEFRALGSFGDSKKLEKEARYRNAAQLADQNQYDEAIELYTDLADENYSDASARLQETKYRKAVYQIYELGEYEAAYNTFVALSSEGYEKADAMIPEAQYWWAVSLADAEDYIGAYQKFKECSRYSDSQDWIDALAAVIYQDGQNQYRKGKYKEAEELFNVIDPYLESSDYLKLLEYHIYPGFSALRVKSNGSISELAALIGFEDAGELIFQNNNAFYFMKGYWSGDCGYIKFLTENSENDWRGQWNLPYVPSGTWQFEDGKFYTGGQERFSIYATSYNSVIITITATGKSYTLWRS